MTKAAAQLSPTDETNDCVFCALPDGPTVVLRNKLAFAVRDRTPVTALHTLVLPYRHAPTYFDLTESELIAVNNLLWRLGSEIIEADPSVRGFNIGANVGVVSGQTIFHCHIHLIPRRNGDIPDPLGGVRAVIPEKMRY
jgi:ATP adenylyltransferase